MKEIQPVGNTDFLPVVFFLFFSFRVFNSKGGVSRLRKTAGGFFFF